MEILVASAVGAMGAGGLYLVLARRAFEVLLGTLLLVTAGNLFVFAAGGLRTGAAPVLEAVRGGNADPVAQALALTAIVISFGTSALVAGLVLCGRLERRARHDERDPTAQAEDPD